jgi:hypothetical protein
MDLMSIAKPFMVKTQRFRPFQNGCSLLKKLPPDP